MSSLGTSALLTTLLLGALAAPARGQDRLFPRVPSFELPLASPRVYGLVGRLLSIDRGESRFGRGHEAEIVLGENFPVIALRRGARPVTLGFGSQVYGRFSLSDPKSALISNDWVVGFNATAGLGRWALTAELSHESSHLGDEYADHFADRRLDWSREVAAGWVAYSVGPWRLVAMGSYALIDELALDPGAAAVAVDYRGRWRRVLGSDVRPTAGMYLDAAGETAWRVSSSACLGVAVSADGRGRELALSLIAHDGLSTQRQFFRNQSRYIGAQIRLDL